MPCQKSIYFLRSFFWLICVFSDINNVGVMQARLPLNGTIQHPDLAEALRGDNGTFFCQQGGQGYIVTAAEGHSIKSLRPVGRKVIEQPVSVLNTPEPWTIQKISDEVLEFEQTARSPSSRS